MTAATLHAAVPTPMRQRATPLTTLVAVELRKAVDTRAGRWLLIAAALVALGAGAIGAFLVDGANRSYVVISQVVFMLSLLLLPVVAILLVTSEWSQRSALTTFALVPRRGRVLLAKIGATLFLSLVGWALSVGVTALATAIGSRPASFPADAVWALSASRLLQSLLFVVLTVGLGFAFALLFLNSAAAIVLNFVLPLVWAILAAVVPWLHDHLQSWLDTGTSWALLLAGGGGNPNGAPDGPSAVDLSGEQWAQVGVSALVWVVLPGVIGAWRMLTREVS